MNEENTVFQQELNKEFLKILHDEKLKTQAERATYTTSKLAFITGLFGLGSLKIGGTNLYGVFYLIPIVAIGYDLYIRAADSSIKKMGAFLRSHPQAGTGISEQAWESFSAKYRDTLASFANVLFTAVIIIVAAIYIYTQIPGQSGGFWAGFILWFSLCLFVNYRLWKSYRHLIQQIDHYTPDTPKSTAS